MTAAPYGTESGRALPRLLIADDDPVVRSTLGMALEHRFDIVAVVADGEEAVAQAAATTPDAALIDVEMPAGGGARAVQGIAAISPATAMVVLSGDESEATVVELLRAGAMSYCRKGVDTHQLTETIQRSIAAHRQLLARAAGDAV
jgi:DNA-binding NarL/FixJ family response regulator